MPHLMVRGNAYKGQTGRGKFAREGPQKSPAWPGTRGLGDFRKGIGFSSKSLSAQVDHPGPAMARSRFQTSLAIPSLLGNSLPRCYLPRCSLPESP
jgi:hypothetical protein